VQVPPFWQGFGVQSLALTSQRVPANPVGQLHVNEFTASLHVPPFWQGLAAHSSAFDSQLAPPKPGRHWH
jgi:hypothetical protein